MPDPIAPIPSPARLPRPAATATPRPAPAPRPVYAADALATSPVVAPLPAPDLTGLSAEEAKFVVDGLLPANFAALRQAHDAGGAKRNGWYYFPESEGIPHPMVHPMEDKGKGHIPQLYAMTLQFLETGKPLDRE